MKKTKKKVAELSVEVDGLGRLRSQVELNEGRFCDLGSTWEGVRIMKNYSGVDLSLFDSLCAKLGPDVVFERYFDEGMNVREDAPEKLKEEIEALRALDDGPKPPPGEVWR